MKEKFKKVLMMLVVCCVIFSMFNCATNTNKENKPTILQVVTREYPSAEIIKVMPENYYYVVVFKREGFCVVGIHKETMKIMFKGCF